MKIIIIVNDFPSISETFISNKVKFLALRNHSLEVICKNKNEPLFADLFKNINNVNVTVFNKKNVLQFLVFHPTILFSVIKGKAYFVQQLFSKYRIEVINKLQPDIIHFEFSGVAIDYLKDLNTIKGKKVVSCRGSAEKVKLLVYEDRKEKFRSILQLADAIHCVSADMRETIMPYCNDSKKIFINFPSIDTQYFTSKKARITKPSKTVLSVGRITFQKGYLIGLLTIKKLKEKGLNFKWIIAGKGPKHEELLFAIHELGLQQNVELLGSQPRSKVKQLMQEADVYFLPSVYEGIANVVLEAMSMQLPVVCTRSGGMEEVIENGVDGFLADINDPELLADYILALCADENLCASLGANARKKIIDRFNIENQINKFEQVYKELSLGNAAEIL